MRQLLQPPVLKWASIAALFSALACFPRLSLWLDRPTPIWYSVTLIFLCGTVLWGFVFAWHTRYSGQPVFVLKPGIKPFVAVTLLGLLVSTVYHVWIDPSLRLIMPKEYPADPKHWLAEVLFSVALTQLFLIFAPFAWLLRLCKNRWVATSLTAAFGAGVLAMKIQSLSAPLPPLLLTALLVGRIVLGFLAVSFYLRGGVILVWWWTMLFEARHLLNFVGNP